MGMPGGPFFINGTLTFSANTHNPATGAAADTDSSPPAFRVYEDETGTAIATGNMSKLDDANTLGFYSEQLSLTAANGYEVGKSYTIYVSATVNSTEGTASLSFTISPDVFARLGAPAGASTAADIAAVKAVVDAILVDTGTTLDTLIDGIVATLGSPAGASMSADIAAIKAAVDNILADTGSLRLKKNTAFPNFTFLMVDSADHVTPKTGLTVTGQVRKDGGAFGALTNSVSEVASGFYTVNLAAADLNADMATLLFTATGADARAIGIITQPV